MKLKEMNHRLFICFLIVVGFTSCESDLFMPKPSSYFRIDFPEKEYETTDLKVPVSFDKAVFSIVQNKSREGDQFNVSYPLHKAKLHFTYFDLEGRDLTAFFEDAYNYAYSHNAKATAIKSKPYDLDSTSVYGLLYDLKGDVASPLQFYATDSTKHFIRGALYFSHKPNADSIQPVLDYIKADVEHFYETLSWE